MDKPRFPEECDLVAVTEKQVDYYGYVTEIDFDMRDPRIRVEFYPGEELWFDFAQVRLVTTPAERMEV